MRKLFYALPMIFMATIMLLLSCGGNKKETLPKVQYFRHLQFSETSYDVPKGTYPLTADQAKTINHYRLTTNDAGKLAEVVYMRGEALLGYSSMDAARIEFTYTDSTETLHFFNQDNQSQESNKAFAWIYKLDNQGKRIGLSYLDKNGNKVANRNNISWYTWKVLPDGMVQEKRYDPSGKETILNPFCPFYELRFSYDTAGYCVRMANYMADTLYNCTAENCGDIGVSYFEFVNDANGALKQFSVHNASGRSSNLYWGWSKFINTMDENGYVTESVYFDQDNEYVGGRNTPINDSKYDEHGAVTERSYMDKDHKLVINTNAGAALFKYSYTETGLPKDTLRFDAAMKEIVKK